MRPIRVYVNPTGLYSRAMVRTANALAKWIPETFLIAGSPSHSYCDLMILHVIGHDATEYARYLRSLGQKYIVIQYCLTADPYQGDSDWLYLWQNSELVWSYYDLNQASEEIGFNFYHAPLGLDDAFASTNYSTLRTSRPLVITSGYVDGPRSEPISEMWKASSIVGIDAIHLGPACIEGMVSYPDNWKTIMFSGDEELANLYRQATWVSGLRHTEGFELPAAEGLACGARPICFDQPAMRHWYGDHAIYVPDCHGEALVQHLVNALRLEINARVSPAERANVIRKFNWQTICSEFWQQAQSVLLEQAA